MSDPKQNSSKLVVVITIIICGTLLIAGGIGAIVYMNHQNLVQQKHLKEAEINAENERAAKQRELDDRKSQRDNTIKLWD